jgi:Cadherin domain
MKLSIKPLISMLTLVIVIFTQFVMPRHAYASGTVGSGTPASCDEAALNTALSGGGAVTFNCGSAPHTITVTTTKTISSDTQINGGGLITISGGGNTQVFTVNSGKHLEITSLSVINGFKNGDGGAIYADSTAIVDITNSTFDGNNTLDGYGGAIFVNAATINITNSTFKNNKADVEGLGDLALGGGAIQNNDGTVVITGSTFSGNSVDSHTADGGAIYNGDFDGGPGVPDGNPDVLTITNSTFYNNQLLNDTSGSAGGAIRSASTLTVTHSTFSNNDSGITETGGEAGALTVTHGTATIINNIFANSSAADCALRSTGTVSGSSGGNLIESNLGCGASISSADPVLGALQNNGGPTETIALGASSPAINVFATCVVSTDQRGVARPQPSGGNCDIGAFEYNQPPTNIALSANTVAENQSSGTVIGTLTTTDADSTTFTYSLVDTGACPGTDNASFQIGGGSGDELRTAAALNFEAGSTRTVCVRTTDSTYNTFDKNLTVNVTNVNEAPTNVTLSPSSIAENQAVNTVVGTLSATDPDAGGSFTFTLACAVAGADDGSFNISGTNLRSSAMFDFETKSSYSICVRVTDQGSLTFDKNLTVNVTDVDEVAPDTTIDSHPSDPSNSPNADFTFSSPDSDVTGFECQLNTGGWAACTSPQNYTGLVSGFYTFEVRAKDNANNVDPTPPSFTWFVDLGYPIVLSVTRVDSNPTANADVDFTVTFSEAVTGVNITAPFDDFTLSTTGVTGASITGVSGSGDTYTVTVNTGTGDGTIRLDVVDDDSIQDSANNPLGDTGAGNGSFTIGEVYDISKTATFNSIALQDGFILESAETSNKGGSKNSTATTLNLGDNAANRQYRSILSFDTLNLPDTAVITKVTLKLKRGSVVGGGNPINTFKGFMVDIKKGDLGIAALELGDFKTAGNMTLGAFKPALVGGWYSLDLTAASQWINASGDTQIRLRFKLDDNNNGVANFLKLYSGNASAANQPQLVIEYYIPSVP